MKRIVGITGVAFVLSATIVTADENPILGTWKVKSFVREVSATGERYNLFGEHPNGYLSYSSDGHMSAIVVADNRVKPHGAAPTDEEAAKLHRTMLAYAGTYTLDAEKVTHHVDVSWDEATTALSDIVRFYKLNGNTLTITTTPFNIDGREGRVIVEWEKVKGPTGGPAER
jgi:hypothetical protein